MNNVFMMILLCHIILGFIAFTPYMTRKTENFGVSIPESLYYRKDFKAMRKKYAFIVLIVLAVISGLLILLTFFVASQTLYIIYIVSLFLYLISGFVIYLPFHRKMKAIKQAEHWQSQKQQTLVVDTGFRMEKLTVSLGWFIIPFLICVGTWLITFLLYDQAPNQIPIHTDFAGNITYDDKTVGTLLMMPGLQLVLLIIFIFVHYIMKVSKQQVNAENPAVSKQQNILFRRRWSVFMLITGTLTIILFLFIQLTFIYPSLIKYEDIAIFSIVGIILIGTIVLSIITGQGGSRIKVNKQIDKTVMDRDDDQFWKLGQFYFNKEDPSIFIEKRFGVGWTNNWAHPLSWILILGIILLAASPMLLLFF